ncbi:CHASE3 domain-containing protein [Mucilaginibacter sp. BT774]|uniref:CHASE3 domain-containing protein n=1 Tax=Mucilaginibacter sp. BT774 TaxID=3062276 RepID=UPI002675CE18|nr:CHASE3 domain-containing protein [Mucilaginibacter sp. BT774]MDO3628816.1 CHASE3 domain-containing protein [Mucilaginibacter sp. BT774]
MTNRFDRNLRIGYGFSLLIVLTIGLVSFLTLQRLLKSNQAVSHSGQVMQKLEQVLSVMKDAETGQRGYLLTGRANFLEPYNGAYNEALNLTGELTTLTADNPQQQTNMASIRIILRQRMDILQQLIGKKQRGQAISLQDLDAGKSAMDTLRHAVAKAEAGEQLLLDARAEKLNSYTNIVPGFIILAALVSLAVTVYSYRKVIRDVREKEHLRAELELREQETAALNEELTAANEEITTSNEELTSINEEVTEAREELQSLNESLEKRVDERTQALATSEEETQVLNEELTATNEELAAANEELQTTNEELADSERRLQKLLQEAILAEERSAKLAAIVESSDDAIIGKTLDGIVTSWNQGAERTFGYTEREMVGESILKLIPKDRYHEETVILSHLKKGERIDHYETIRCKKDGTPIQVSLTISPIRNKAGEIVGISKIARDITEQKRDEQRKNDFIGMASHELKTPLTSLTALIQVLQQKVQENGDGFMSSALARANSQTKRMAGLINGFLNVSRLESGKLLIEQHPFELNALISEMIEEMRLSVNTHTFVFEPVGELVVDADREKIGSVLSNLLSNAVKYSPKGKIVTVKCTVETEMVTISVHDEGIGINPHDMKRLFDRFYRVQSEHTRHISGFGVGLYLSAEIIERHGGHIWAESERDKGSTFYFTLPMAEPA